MLTQDQKDQLTQLMNDCPIPKLKKVLEEGLPRFISGEIEPSQRRSGVDRNIDGTFYSTNGSCCLLGSASIGKKDPSCSLSSDDVFILILAFDGRTYSEEYDKEIYDYVSKIRKVIFGC